MKNKLQKTIYNRNHGEFEYVRMQAELLTYLLDRKLTHLNK